MGVENLRYLYEENPTTVIISAKANTSHRIIEMWVDDPAPNSWVDIQVGRVIVARIPISLGDSLFVAPYTGSIYNESIMALIRKLFGNDTYIEADEDENITMTFSDSPGAVHILYEEDKAGIDKRKILHSQAQALALFHILTHSKDVNANGEYALDTVKAPTGFPQFRDGKALESGTRFTLRALVFGTAASGSTSPTYLHVWRKTFELFTPETHSGLTVKPGNNVLVGDIKTMDFFRVPDYAFLPGEEITLRFEAVYDGTNTLSAESAYLVLVGLYEMAK